VVSGRGTAWHLRVTVPSFAVQAFEAALGQLGGAVASNLPGPDDHAILESYSGKEPDRAKVTALLCSAALASGIAPPDFDIARLPDLDWVAEGRKALAPVHAGRFFIFGAHVCEPPPPGSIPIQIEASVAFGTGQHETTHGCLQALDEIKRRRGIARALDMGCGTGILALAVAKLWRAPVLAVDNDPDAVRLTQENAAINGVQGLVRAELGDGYGCPAVLAGAPYDLITANILAGPLRDMAPDLIRHLAPGGVAVLSGLLSDQALEVTASHRPLRLVRDIGLGEWSILVLTSET